MSELVSQPTAKPTRKVLWAGLATVALLAAAIGIHALNVWVFPEGQGVPIGPEVFLAPLGGLIAFIVAYFKKEAA